MQIPVSWLKDFVDFSLSPAELCDRLNSAGLEVAGMRTIGDWGDKVVVGRIKAIRHHPNSDQLQLAAVDIGADELPEVVCGAPNIAVGQKIAFARAGAVLHNPATGQADIKLKPIKIRGILSAGMICSERELNLGDEHDGILVLEDGLKAGMPLHKIFGDTVIELEPTPNRPDWFGIFGVAREVSALTGSPLKPLELDYAEGDVPVKQVAEAFIEDTDLCSRFMCGVVNDLKVMPSPVWLQNRLRAIGERPINNIVDTTNYVMLETGQPLHAFDYDKLNKGSIVVRRAKSGENLTTLDGKEYEFKTNDLFITNNGQAVALAGVMGGQETQIEPETTTILLEAANFNGSNTRRMSQHLKLRTQASLRFEKGLHPANAEIGLKRCIRMLTQMAGGKAAKGLVDFYPQKRADSSVSLNRKQIKRVLGVGWSDEKVENTLSALGFALKNSAQGSWDVGVPFWRTDVAIAEDLCEELSRIIGYDTIQSVPLASELPANVMETDVKLKSKAYNACVQFGLQQVITYSAVPRELDDLCNRDSACAALDLANPVSAKHSVMRRSLRANLLNVACHNLNAFAERIAIFEFGHIYGRVDDRLIENDSIAGLFVGRRSKLHWRGSSDNYDFYDAKGCIENILETLKIKARFETDENNFFTAGRSLTVKTAQGDLLGVLGEVRQSILNQFSISAPVVAMFELNWHALRGLVNKNSENIRYSPIVRLPSITRDLSLIVDQTVSAQDLVNIIEKPKLVKSVAVFGLYQSHKLPPNKKSIAIRVIYQANNRTLTSEEAEKTENKILNKLESELGARLRSEIGT